MVIYTNSKAKLESLKGLNVNSPGLRPGYIMFYEPPLEGLNVRDAHDLACSLALSDLQSVLSGKKSTFVHWSVFCVVTLN